eukprot:gene2089-1270_t
MEGLGAWFCLELLIDIHYASDESVWRLLILICSSSPLQEEAAAAAFQTEALLAISRGRTPPLPLHSFSS